MVGWSSTSSVVMPYSAASNVAARSGIEASRWREGGLGARPT
jgi:hypothetical protein